MIRVARSQRRRYGLAMRGRPLLVLVVSMGIPAISSAATGTATVADPIPDPAPRTPLFRLDPVFTGAILSGALGFGVLSELILSTGEIRPQEPLDPSVLLGIDRPTAESNHVEPGADTLSDVGLTMAIGLSVADAILSEARDLPDGWLTPVALYAETFAFNWVIGNTAKVAVRRPRPIAYYEKRQTGMSSDDTNSGLSFYSLHTAVVAGFGATATYLAIARQAPWWETGLTLAAGVGLTAFVGWNRVRARSHFPTDIIAGALAGASIGTLVPHLQRNPGSYSVSFFGDGQESGGLMVMGTFD